jgi:N-acylneuraminate cytidylyltransferase
MSAIAIITARGGSKRIPKKNIRKFCGKPIMAYSIEAALDSGMFDEVMVSTDSEEIASIAKEYGANVPFLRSVATSDDYSTTADVLSEVLEQYEKLGKNYDYIGCLYPTAPFVTADKLKKAFDEVGEKNADAAVPVVRYGFPPQRAFVIRDGRVQYSHPEHERTRSQDLEPIYHDCGQFYICRVDKFKECHSMIAGNVIPLIMPEEEVQDIDTLSDWKLAEIKYTLMRESESVNE